VRDCRHLKAVAADDLADWLVYLDVDNKSAKTLYGYAREIAPLLRAHPGKRLDEFTHLDVMEEIRQKPPRSRHITRSIYSSWFTWALEQERVERNPMLKVPKIRSPKERPKDIFTDTERACLEGLPAPDGPLWTILFGAGLRRGEACRLRRGNIDLERARIAVIAGKGDKDRTIGIPRVVIQAVADLDLFERLAAAEHLWYRRRFRVGDHRRRNDPIGSSTFDLWYRRGISDAGVRYLNPHQTRHTYGYWLRGENFTLQERALLMGHEDLRTTQRYDRMSVDDIAVKMAAL
jgi:integrase